jgi:hypothetical protein
MTDDNDVYTPAQYREHQDGYGYREPDAHPHAGIVRDEQVSRYLAILSEEYDPDATDEPERMPGRAEELDEVRQIRRVAATETARSALDGGDMPTLKHLTGDQTEQADISGMKAVQRVDEILTSPAPVVVILGEMGAGKTDFAGLLGQRLRHLTHQAGERLQVASNIQSLKETDPWTDRDGEPRSGFVANHPNLMEWVKQDGDPLEHPQTPKLFIGDEFSSAADGSGKSGHRVRKKMGPLVFKIRKYGGTLFYIAHDEASIHPLLWRLGVIVKKESQKKAVVAESVKNGELRGTEDPIVGVPQTDWRYRTEEASSWSWTTTDTDEEPEPDEVAYNVALWTVRECQENGLSYRETAKFVPYGKSWVSDRASEIEEGEHIEAMDTVEALTA